MDLFAIKSAILLSRKLGQGCLGIYRCLLCVLLSFSFLLSLPLFAFYVLVLFFFYLVQNNPKKTSKLALSGWVSLGSVDEKPLRCHCLL